MAVSNNTILDLDRGMYKFIANNTLSNYNIVYFKGWINMATVAIENSLRKPIIIISGDYGVGKSYINKVIKKYINSVASINK